MTRFVINRVKTFHKYIPNIKVASYDNLGEKVYSAQEIQRIFGVFVSQVVVGDESLVSWHDIVWTGTKVTGTDISLYIRTASTETELMSATWYGPFLNETADISELKGRYMQFMVILSNENINVGSYPVVESIKLTYLSSESAVKFYTVAFDLGFVPKHILLTYNGEVTEDSIVRFAVSGFDSIDSDDYQYIDPNKIEELTELSLLSTKLKIMIEMMGESGATVTIDEFALMFSGDAQLRLNDVSSSSSSSSNSSSSSSSIL